MGFLGRQGAGGFKDGGVAYFSLTRALRDPEKHTHITIRGHGIMAY